MDKKYVRICCGRKCSEAGSERIMSMLEYHYKAAAGKENDSVDLDYSGCQDYCEIGPNVTVDNMIYHRAKPRDIIERIERGDGKQLKKITEDDINIDDLLAL